MVVDLRSDTVTKPTPGMRRAIANAVVGDDVLGDDPTVQRLEALAAEWTGKEAGLFVPSGTMGNQVAIRLHTRPGDEVLAHADSHPFNWEAGGAAVISGVQIRPLPGARGLLEPATVSQAVRGPDPHVAPARLLTVEDTANRGGGTVHSLERLDALAATAKAHGLKTHMDGARAFNAAVASGVPLARRAEGFDTITFCLSKGLGAPVGSVLCGPADAMTEARRVRKMLGGGMRQAGILAAAGIYALEHHVDRLAEDHDRAKRLARWLSELGLQVAEPDSNILIVGGIEDAPALQTALGLEGVACFAVGPHALRLVLHLDVDDAGVAYAVDAVGRALNP